MTKVLGGILLAVGILIAGASGLCSLAMLISFFSSGSTFTDLGDGLPLVAIFGGIPFAAGIGLLFAGRQLLRRAE